MSLQESIHRKRQQKSAAESQLEDLIRQLADGTEVAVEVIDDVLELNDVEATDLANMVEKEKQRRADEATIARIPELKRKLQEISKKFNNERDGELRLLDDAKDRHKAKLLEISIAEKQETAGLEIELAEAEALKNRLHKPKEIKPRQPGNYVGGVLQGINLPGFEHSRSLANESEDG